MSDGGGVGDGLVEMGVIILREVVESVVERERRYLCLNVCDAERVDKSFPYLMQKETKLVCFFRICSKIPRTEPQQDPGGGSCDSAASRVVFALGFVGRGQGGGRELPSRFAQLSPTQHGWMWDL